MKRGTRLFWLFYLIYFACYAVAPVSAVLPDKETPDFTGEHNVLEDRDRQTYFFLFDLALWNILKKTKCSDGSENVILESEQKQNNPENTSSTIFGLTQDSASAVTAPFPAASALYSDLPLHCLAGCFDHSGLSPPPSA